MLGSEEGLKIKNKGLLFSSLILTSSQPRRVSSGQIKHLQLLEQLDRGSGQNKRRERERDTETETETDTDRHRQRERVKERERGWGACVDPYL